MPGVSFPFKGMDLSDAFTDQAQGTTIEGKNVRVFDVLAERGRGGSRPGLIKFVPEQLPLTTPIAAAPLDHLIQHLNIIVWNSVDALVGTPDYPPPDYVEDPSSPGPPDSWGTATIYSNGVTITGASNGSRNPGGPGSNGQVYPRRIRNGGSAKPPNKNSPRTARPDVLDPALLGPTPRYKFLGFAEYTYQVNLAGFPQDQSVTFNGVTCWPYNPVIGLYPPGGPADLPTLQEAKNAYFARIAYQNPQGISLVRSWWASQDANGFPLPSGSICDCADIHTYGGYDGSPGNSVPCPEGT